MKRTRTLLQLLGGWLPVAVLLAILVAAAHGVSPSLAAQLAIRMVVTAAVLGYAVYRLTAHVPWLHPLRAGFFLLHLGGSVIYALLWLLLNSLIDSTQRSLHGASLQWEWATGPGLVPTLTLGVLLYLIIIGVAYAQRAAERAARVDALAARTQLAALRAQLHPHLLFNALHTVVQLIPLDPKRAIGAAETLADLLRAALAQDRDVVSLAQEWTFVQRYLAIETLRFGERLQLDVAIEDTAQSALLPAFALQTLVENAVRHGAAPRIEATIIRIRAELRGERLLLRVEDSGAGTDMACIPTGNGTGLKRLREQLHRLSNGQARMELVSAPQRGFAATLDIPQRMLIEDIADD